jgi:hypothetical protein
VPLVVNSSLDVSVFSASPTFGTAILTLGLQTVVIPIREFGAPPRVIVVAFLVSRYFQDPAS